MQNFLQYLAQLFEDGPLSAHGAWRDRISLAHYTLSGSVADLMTEPGRTTLLARMLDCAPPFDVSSRPCRSFLALMGEVLLHEIEEYHAIMQRGGITIEQAVQNEAAMQIGHDFACERSFHRFMMAEPEQVAMFWESLYDLEPQGFRLDREYQERLELISLERGILVRDEEDETAGEGASEDWRIDLTPVPAQAASEETHRIAAMAAGLAPVPEGTRLGLLSSLPDGSSAHRYTGPNEEHRLLFIYEHDADLDEPPQDGLYDGVNPGGELTCLPRRFDQTTVENATVVITDQPEGHRLRELDFSGWSPRQKANLGLFIAKTLRDLVRQRHVAFYVNPDLCWISDTLFIDPNRLEEFPPVLCPYAMPESESADPEVVPWQGYGEILAQVFAVTAEMIASVARHSSKMSASGKKLVIKGNRIRRVRGKSEAEESGAAVPKSVIKLVRDLQSDNKVPAIYRRITLVLNGYAEAAEPSKKKYSLPAKAAEKAFGPASELHAYRKRQRVAFDPSVLMTTTRDVLAKAKKVTREVILKASQSIPDLSLDSDNSVKSATGSIPSV
jgi:hypothetical protein